MSRDSNKRQRSVVECRLCADQWGASRVGLTIVFSFLRVQTRFTSSPNPSSAGAMHKYMVLPFPSLQRRYVQISNGFLGGHFRYCLNVRM